MTVAVKSARVLSRPLPVEVVKFRSPTWPVSWPPNTQILTTTIFVTKVATFDSILGAANLLSASPEKSENRIRRLIRSTSKEAVRSVTALVP